MDLIVEVPDDIARRLGADSGQLSRRALEVWSLEEFKCGNITKPELRRLLGFATRGALDGFLKAHNVYEEYTPEDLELEREGLRRLGF